MRNRHFRKLGTFWNDLLDSSWSPRNLLTRPQSGRFPATPLLRAIPLHADRMEERIVMDGRPLPLPYLFAGTASGAPPRVRAYHADTGELAFEVQPFDASRAACGSPPGT